MKAASALIVLISTLVVNAHFRINFPPPRGEFVEDDEPTFCDGFTNVTTNRTEFPLSGGFFTLVSEHPSWSAAFYVSTAANPNSFDNFMQVNSFFQLSGEGTFCIPLDLTSSNFTGLKEGQNITIQMLFDGGDGDLFQASNLMDTILSAYSSRITQCSDLTLTNSNSSISSVQCTNSTNGQDSDSGSGSGGTGTGTLGAALDFKLLGLLGVASLIPLVM